MRVRVDTWLDPLGDYANTGYQISQSLFGLATGLSAEIVVITLGTMATAPLMQQVVALSAVAIGATVLVFNSRDPAFGHTPELDGEKIKDAMLATKHEIVLGIIGGLKFGKIGNLDPAWTAPCRPHIQENDLAM